MTNLAALLNTWQQWNAHHVTTHAGQEAAKPTTSALDALRDSHELVELLTGWRWQAVHVARRDGASWRRIAAATGATVEQARGEYVAVLDRQEQVLGRDVSVYREVLTLDGSAPWAPRSPAPEPETNSGIVLAVRDDLFPPAPKAHKSAVAVAAKRRALGEEHIAPLTALAERIQTRCPAEVPLFDPASGGTESRVLLLLASPGKKSTRGGTGSGFISVDNDDPTAPNTFKAMAEAGLTRAVTLNWNIVPWFLGERRDPSEDELVAARPFLSELLSLLPNLRVVVLLGDAARDGWKLQNPPGGIDVISDVPHPSPSSLNTRPERRPRLLAALRRAADLAG